MSLSLGTAQETFKSQDSTVLSEGETGNLREHLCRVLIGILVQGDRVEEPR